jgi:NTP pyrophosphatase (non-canonical NTP hydrolase)
MIDDRTELMEYQEFVYSTTSKAATVGGLEEWWAASGLVVEASELMELYEKTYRKTGTTDVPSEAVLDELGDVLWYAAAVANACGITLDDVIEYNISKITKRHYADENAE